MSTRKYQLNLPIRLISSSENGLRICYEDQEQPCWFNLNLSIQAFLIKFTDDHSYVNVNVTETKGLLGGTSKKTDVVQVYINRHYQNL